MKNTICKKIAQKESKYQQEMSEHHWELILILYFKLKCLTKGCDSGGRNVLKRRLPAAKLTTENKELANKYS